jgi:CDP-6-deoxy-D-xylo-4-hexulose-3-dehydrase
VNKCADAIEIRPVVGGDMTEQPFYKKYMPQYVDDMKGSNASLVHRQGLYFGNNPELTDQEIAEIIKIFT